MRVAGAALVVAGAGLALWGLVHRYSNDLALERVNRGWRGAIRTLGALSDLARGFLLALGGDYLVGTALSDNPAQAKAIDRTLVHHPYGAIMIGLVALGLLRFGVYFFFDARLRRL